MHAQNSTIANRRFISSIKAVKKKSKNKTQSIISKIIKSVFIIRDREKTHPQNNKYLVLISAYKVKNWKDDRFYTH